MTISQVLVKETELATVEVIIPGPQGLGSAWQQGAGVPSSGTGAVGDFYLNTSNGDIYGPKTSGGWGSVVFNIAQGQQGPTGPAGATGPQGPAGVVAATAPITYDAGTQTVAITAATTSAAGSMSAADKTKLDGIAAGAEVNVNADWNAGSGDAQILNKPTLGSAAAQNVGTAAGNVVQLDGSGKLPAVDGSALTGLPPGITDLGYTASTRLLTSSTGADVTLPLVTTSDAGLMAAADKTKIDGIAAGATVNSSDATLLARANHTGTQTASTISDFTSTARGAISASGSLSYNSTTGVLSYTAPTPFDPASPGAIGGTTPAAGSFTALTASTRLGLPSSAPASPAAGDIYRVIDTLRYRDSGGAERLLLNASDNLANLASAATARTNLGLGTAATSAATAFAASGGITSSGLTMATARLLGRTTAGAGAVEEIAVSGGTLSGGTLTISGGSTNASDLTSGTLNDARLSAKVMAAVNVTLWSNFR